MTWQPAPSTDVPDEVLVDPLTGLWNHRAFQDRLAAAVAGGRRVAVAVVDIDDFAGINASAGYAAGDRVLAAVGRRLSAAAGADTVARIAADEFALILLDADARAARAAVDRARSAIHASSALRGLAVTVSAGVCDSRRGGHADGLLDRAVAALSWARCSGRDGTAVHDVAARCEVHVGADTADTFAAIRALARAIDAKDRTTSEHSDRVARLARRLAQTLGWPPRRVRLLEEAALIHDVGKIGVPDAILLKPDRLDAAEFEAVKRHAELGADIAAGLLAPEQVEWIRGHHERPDGRGYPDGRRAGRISEGAAILAVADAFDVMTVERPYGRPKPVAEALAECQALAGRQFAPEPVTALLRIGEGRLTELR